MHFAHLFFSFLFFFNDTATTEIYTLSLHDALPISARRPRPTRSSLGRRRSRRPARRVSPSSARDRKSTRLHSSHVEISYAVFCLKKKKKKKTDKNKKKQKKNKNRSTTKDNKNITQQ